MRRETGDTGGVAAHAAIVAREYGLPAVVGTIDATGRLRDGKMVEVDGSAGVVRRFDGSDAVSRPSVARGRHEGD